MDEQKNYTLSKEYQTQVVEKVVEYMIADLKKYFSNEQTGEISYQAIKDYIQRCINLYINYTVIDKVITMTGLKERILKQDEFSSLGNIIILAREFALYHNILELESTPEGKESWESLLNELTVLLSTGRVYSRTYEKFMEQLDELIDEEINGIEHTQNTGFIEVLTGERQIKLSIHGIKGVTEDNLKMPYDKAIEYFDETILDFGYDKTTSCLAELNIDNGIGEYQYSYTKFNILHDKNDFDEDVYEKIDLLSALADLIMKYVNHEADQEALGAIKCELKNMIYPHSEGYGLHGLEFSPLGISHVVAYYYLLKIKRISEKIKKIANITTDTARKRGIKEFDKEEEVSSFKAELWDLSFNPVSKVGLKENNDDVNGGGLHSRDVSIANYSWKQNAYSLENIIGSVLDAIGSYSSISYDTSMDAHREPEYTGYYIGMFGNANDKHQNIISKKKNPQTNIQKKNAKGKSKRYAFHFDGKNPSGFNYNDIDFINHACDYNIDFPKELKIILPLCIDTEESELFNMIRSLSMCYPKVLDINDSEDQLAYIINMYSEMARFKDWTEQHTHEVKRLKKELKSNTTLTTEEVQKITFDIMQHDQLLLAYENILNGLKKSYQLWEVDRQQWIDNYTKELDTIRTMILSNKVTIAVNEYHDKIKCISQQSYDSKEAADAIDKQIKAETQSYYDNINQIIESITNPTELFICQTARYPGRLKILLAAVEVLLKVYDPNTTDKDIKDKTLKSFKKKITNAKYPYIITNHSYYNYYDEDTLDEEKLAKLREQREKQKKKKQNGSGSQTTSGI